MTGEEIGNKLADMALKAQGKGLWAVRLNPSMYSSVLRYLASANLTRESLGVELYIDSGLVNNTFIPIYRQEDEVFLPAHYDRLRKVMEKALDIINNKTERSGELIAADLSLIVFEGATVVYDDVENWYKVFYRTVLFAIIWKYDWKIASYM